MAEAGIPLGYEVSPGNTWDGTILETVVEQMEKRYGLAERLRKAYIQLTEAETAFKQR